MDTQIVPRAGRSRTASTQGAQHPEGFNLLRIAAAVGVIVGHAFLLSRPASQFVALHFTDANFYLGRLSVGVFFAISGYLITASWYAGPHVRRFAVKRVRRIYPALAVMVVVVTFVVGPIVTAVASAGQLAVLGPSRSPRFTRCRSRLSAPSPFRCLPSQWGGWRYGGHNR